MNILIAPMKLYTEVDKTNVIGFTRLCQQERKHKKTTPSLAQTLPN